MDQPTPTPERARGQLLQGQRVAVPLLEATFWVRRQPDGSEAWAGELEVPGPGLELELDYTYELVLQDGRRGSVRVRRLRTSLSTFLPSRVNFDGIGPPPR